MCKKQRFIHVLMAFMLLIMSACSGNGASGDADVTPTSKPLIGEEDLAAYEDLSESAGISIMEMPGEWTLDIATVFSYTGVAQMAQRFMDRYPNVTINITDFGDDYETYLLSMREALEKGEAPDVLDGVSLYNDPAVNWRLADIGALMENDPNFNQNDFLLNVIEAFRDPNGSLYVFPDDFQCAYMTVNTTVSEQLTKTFKTYTSVSAIDLVDIYYAAPLGKSYFLNDSFDVWTAVSEIVFMFVDMANKTCDFNNDTFIQFITDAENLTDPEKIFGYTYSNWQYYKQDEMKRAEQYLFQQAYNFNYQYFFEYADYGPLFSHIIPLTNDKGEQQVGALRTLSISEQSENKALAWEFIKFMTQQEAHIPEEANSDAAAFDYVYCMPVYKPFIRAHLEAMLPGALTGYIGKNMWRIQGTRDDQVESLIQYWENYGNVPVYTSLAMNAWGILYEELLQFHEGAITAAQAAANLQERVSVALREETE